MTTARTIIKKAMQKAGILTKTENPSPDESSDALDTLNALLSSLSNDSMMIYARVWENFTLSAGTGSYTIGASQTFNTARPIQIVSAFVRLGTTDYALSPISDEVYNNFISSKSTQGIPEFINNDNGFPAATLRLYPIPSTAYVLHIQSEKELTTLTIDQVLSLPPGWEHMLVHNLAILLAPEYGQPVDQMLYQIAKEAKASIAAAVNKNRNMDAQPATLGGFNIYSGV